MHLPEKLCQEKCEHELCNKVKIDAEESLKGIHEFASKLADTMAKFKECAEKYNESVNSDNKEDALENIFECFHSLIMAKYMVNQFYDLKTIMDEVSSTLEDQLNLLLELIPKELQKGIKEKWNNLHINKPKKSWKLW